MATKSKQVPLPDLKGQSFRIQKSKHPWNNGTKVTIIGIHKSKYCRGCYEGKDTLGNIFLLGPENLKSL